MAQTTIYGVFDISQSCPELHALYTDEKNANTGCQTAKKYAHRLAIECDCDEGTYVVKPLTLFGSMTEKQSITGNEYQELAMRTRRQDLNSREMLNNAILGLCGKTGEVAELIKKEFYHDTPIDITHLKKELGDVMWYIALAATASGINLDDIMTTNIEKLKNRYPDGFSSENSKHRAPEDI